MALPDPISIHTLSHVPYQALKTIYYSFNKYGGKATVYLSDFYARDRLFITSVQVVPIGDIQSAGAPNISIGTYLRDGNPVNGSVILAPTPIAINIGNPIQAGGVQIGSNDAGYIGFEISEELTAGTFAILLDGIYGGTV